jgi:molybdate transport system substrate-binding protein
MAATSGVILLFLSAASLVASCRPHQARSVSVAVAANFTEPAKEIAQRFQETTGNSVVLSFASTGQLFTPEGFGLAGSVFTYAVGQLVLFSPNFDLSNGEAVLREGRFEKLAIANPVTAPYGSAAVETMKALGLEQHLRGKLVQGNNISQTFQFVETGNVELGFVARSQVAAEDSKSIWIVPESLYSPIRQDAVLLRKGSENPVARAFLEFLRGQAAFAIVGKYGYAHTQ